MSLDDTETNMANSEPLPIPPATEVRERLSIAVREAELLRRLLRLSERAEREFPQHPPATTTQKVQP